MNNAYTPAMPLSVASDGSGDVLNSSDFEDGTGLTKREHFAGLAMQGLLSGREGAPDFGRVARNAVFAADRLLDQLEAK